MQAIAIDQIELVQTCTSKVIFRVKTQQNNSRLLTRMDLPFPPVKTYPSRSIEGFESLKANFYRELKKIEKLFIINVSEFAEKFRNTMLCGARREKFLFSKRSEHARKESRAIQKIRDYQSRVNDSKQSQMGLIKPIFTSEIMLVNKIEPTVQVINLASILEEVSLCQVEKVALVNSICEERYQIAPIVLIEATITKEETPQKPSNTIVLVNLRKIKIAAPRWLEEYNLKVLEKPYLLTGPKIYGSNKISLLFRLSHTTPWCKKNSGEKLHYKKSKVRKHLRKENKKPQVRLNKDAGRKGSKQIYKFNSKEYGKSLF